MALQIKKRHGSLNHLGYSTLKELKEKQQTRKSNKSISILRNFRTTYQRPFAMKKQHQNDEQTLEQEEHKSSHLLRQDFQVKCRRVCEDICFSLSVFVKLYQDSYRKKSVLIKLYGWDKEFQEIFFYKNREDVRSDITPASVYNQLGFSVKNFTTRNRFNKLRLFLSEVVANNQRQQELQSKFMKIRIDSQLAKVDNRMELILRDRQKKQLRKYIDQIGSAHEMMIQSKLRAHNMFGNIIQLQKTTGRVSVNDYYGKQENDIHDVEMYFTQRRLEKHK